MAYVGQPTQCGFVEEHHIPGTRLVAYRYCFRKLQSRMWGSCEEDGHLFSDRVDGIRVTDLGEDSVVVREPATDSSGTTETPWLLPYICEECCIEVIPGGEVPKGERPVCRDCREKEAT